MTEPKKGVVLFAHGSRDERWKKPFIELEKRLSKKNGNTMVRAGFLQDCTPSLYDVVNDMAGAGCRNIVVAPVFLAIGAHAGKDFPVMAKKLEEDYPEVDFEWTEVIGQWEETLNALSEVIAKRLLG